MGEIARHLARRRALAEDPVDAEVGSRTRVEPRPTGDDEWPGHTVVRRLDGGRDLADVMEVRIPLRDDLADEDRVGALGLRPLGERDRVDLRPEVDDADLPVGLEPLLPRKTLDRQ